MANNTTIVLWSNTADRKCVAKESFLRNRTIIDESFRMKEPCSILAPDIQLASSTVTSRKLPLNKANYCYISRFARYYFIDDIIFLNDGIVEMHLSIDVLMTYRKEIYSSQQEVVRAESLNSPRFIDNERPILTDKILTTKILGAFPESSGNNYALTVAGG